MPDEHAMGALWYHKTDVTQKMSAQTDTYIIPKSSKKKLADSYWDQRGRLLMPQRIFLPTVRCMSVRLDEQALGSAWTICKLHSNKYDGEILEKALCVYLNSSVGVLAMLGDRSNKKPTYPQFSLDDLRRIPVPDFVEMDEAKVKMMAAAYDDLCDSILLPLPQMNECDTRKQLDDIIVAALDIDAETTAAIRRELTREPSITGRPYEQN